MRFTNILNWTNAPKGILRYKVDFQSMQTDEEPLDDVNLDDY